MTNRWLTILLTATALWMAPAAARALPAEGPQPGAPGYTPKPLQDIGVDEKRDQQVPLNLAFTDESGRSVVLSELVDDKPVVLQLGYFECPMLCDLVAQGWVESIAALDLNLGRDFEVISLSISPDETAKVATLKKNAFLRGLDKPISGSAVHFLVGSSANITAITEAVGYRYKYIPAVDEYSHPAVIIVLTPEGVISQYLYGVKFDSQELETAIRNARTGEPNSPLQQFLMTCFHYTKQNVNVLWIMRVGGALTVLIVAWIIVRQLLRERKQATVTKDYQPGHSPVAS